MYSLGIILFEMCHEPFKTVKEREEVLQKIRQPNYVVEIGSVLPFQEVIKNLKMLIVNSNGDYANF